MMLNEFYCADLDAPVVLEVVRDGVVYARVYDIRGRSVSTLTCGIRPPTNELAAMDEQAMTAGLCVRRLRHAV